MTPPAPYRLQDALLGLFVGLWLTVLPGYGLYAMAPETLRCDRDAGGGACRLTRHVLGVPVRTTVMAGVRGATLEEYYSSPRVVFNRRDPGGYTYHVRYETSTGHVDGAESGVRDEHQALVDGLLAFLADRTAPPYQGALQAGSPVARLALGILFVFGVLCLINIPFATAAALRR